MSRWLVAGLLLCGAAWANHAGNPSASWNELREKNLKLGFPVDRVDRTLAGCRASELSVGQAEDLLCPVYAAHAEGLPTDCVFLKIEEGLAKRISWEEVRNAADRRLECLRKADELVMSVRQGRGGQRRHLVMRTCMAVESGLPVAVLEDVFARQGGFRYGRLVHVIEAAESLQLAGLAAEHTRHIMHDCLDRDLTGDEVFRAVDVLQSGLRSGKDFKTIHDALWVSSGAVCTNR